MTNKHEIEIEGLPDGWRAVAYRMPLRNENYLYSGEVHVAGDNIRFEYLIVEKIQLRRIVLEETEEDNHKDDIGRWQEQYFMDGEIVIQYGSKIWREVKEE